jgi:hypothetical protein
VAAALGVAWGKKKAAPPAPGKAPPKPAAKCGLCEGSPAAGDELSGSTYVWVKDSGGDTPATGAVVRMELYGGQVDIDATKEAGDLVVWTGKYALAGGKITLDIPDMPTMAVAAPGKPYTKSGDDLTLPFGVVKGKGTSLWHRSKHAIQTKLVRAACPLTGGMKYECSRPGGPGTHSFAKDCLYEDTSLDGKLLEHHFACVVSCDLDQSHPEAEACSPCIASLENKVTFSNFDALDPKTGEVCCQCFAGAFSCSLCPGQADAAVPDASLDAGD